MAAKLLTTIELDVLSYLAKRNVCHGSEIMAYINSKRKALDLRPTQEGAFAPVLVRLAANELITSSWGEGSQGARRKYHKITSLGVKTLRTNQAYRKLMEE